MSIRLRYERMDGCKGRKGKDSVLMSSKLTINSPSACFSKEVIARLFVFMKEDHSHHHGSFPSINQLNQVESRF